jgi:uncharacterized protein (DUF305 family)
MIFSNRPAQTLDWLAIVLLIAVMLGAASPVPASPQEAKFLAENRAAMSRMMNGMDVQPSGNLDHDFVSLMVAHHQGAIDMALAELRFGHNERLQRIAQEIIVGQEQEISAMRLALKLSSRQRTFEPNDSDHDTQQTRAERRQ